MIIRGTKMDSPKHWIEYAAGKELTERDNANGDIDPCVFVHYSDSIELRKACFPEPANKLQMRSKHASRS